jgi:hypothetical protein
MKLSAGRFRRLLPQCPYPALAAIRPNSPPAITHSRFEAAKELGRFDVESRGNLDQSSNVWTPQATLNQADRGSICVHLTRQPILRDVSFFPNLPHYLAQLLFQPRDRLNLLIACGCTLFRSHQVNLATM